MDIAPPVSTTLAIFSVAHLRRRGSGSPEGLTLAMANAKAPMTSPVVATHSKGFNSRPASSRTMGMFSSGSNRSLPNIFNSAERGTNGYMVRKTERHFGHRPHHESDRLRLQLLKTSKNAVNFENNLPI